ncbi:MAG: filamentous hemagglutinin N-terminal domain-containing protein [Negativicutes bacterium]|nr:filamentous hemagglutinin N-terminal domain-containing protein [Negativicutes bacterium]
MFAKTWTGTKKGKWITNLTLWVFILTLTVQPLTVSAAEVVQIAAPNAAGVSRNLYTQLDVGPAGLILNNSASSVQTQLGGQINGNANLAGGPAKIILNEVTGTGVSQLRGFIEVAGQRAEVIIANPNGIVVDGAGFINASRAVLTTGTPVFGGSGSLDSFRVSGGQIAIQGAGLDATGAGRLDLITRAVSVGGVINANELNVITGANTVDYATLNTQHTRGAGQAPAVAIDVAALGGMYAGKIRLVSTDRGVGVNNLGAISAFSGNVTIDSKGKVRLAGSTAAAGNISVKAVSMDLSGSQVNAGAAVSLTATQGDINNTGGSINAAGALTVTTPGAFVNSQYGMVNAAANTNITAASLQNNQGFISSGGDLTITLQGAGNTQSTASNSYRFTSFCGDSRGSVPSTGSSSQYAVDNTNGFISAGGNLAITAGSGGTSGNSYQFTGYCNESKGSTGTTSNVQYLINNTGGYVSAGGDLSLTVQLAGKTQATTGGYDKCSSPATVFASSPQYVIDNTSGYISGNNVTVTVLGTSSSTSSNDYSFSSYCGSSNNSAQSSSVNTIYALNNNNGYINANNNLSVTAQDGSGQLASYTSGFRADCTSSQNQPKTTNSNNQYFIDNTFGTINAGGDAKLTVQGDVTTTTVVSYVKSAATKCSSSKTTKVTTTTTSADSTIDNTNGTISAGGNLTITTQGTVNNTDGTLDSGDKTNISAFSVQNQQGTIVGDDGVKISTNKPFDTKAGQVLTGGSLVVTNL